MSLSIQLCSLHLWSPPNKDGLSYTISQQLNIWITKQASLVKHMEQVFSETMLSNSLMTFQVKYGVITYSSTDLKSVIPSFLGKTSLIRITTNFLLTWVTSFTESCNFYTTTMSIKYLKLLNSSWMKQISTSLTSYKIDISNIVNFLTKSRSKKALNSVCR